MTIVEFFDESQTENIMGVLCSNYERVIYIGDSSVMNKTAVMRIKSFIKERYPKVKAEFIVAKCDDVADVSVKLTEIVLQYRDCCFEATGGTDAGLIALGIISERYGVPIVKNDVKGERDILERISLFETIELNGGILEGYEQNSFNIDTQLRRDVSIMWQLGFDDCEYWIKGGRFLSSLQPDLRGLSVFSQKKPTDRQRDFLDDLKRVGFIHSLEISRGRLCFTYRDEELRKTLIKSGNLLELTTFFAVLSRNPHSDAHRGVQLLWRDDRRNADGSRVSNETVRNEVDVLFMRGICPVFVSCKAGNVDKEALYELEAVANKFGGKYARKIIVVGCLEHNNKNPAQFIERARNMGITVIDNACKMSPDRLGQEISGILL